MNLIDNELAAACSSVTCIFSEDPLTENCSIGSAIRTESDASPSLTVIYMSPGGE